MARTKNLLAAALLFVAVSATAPGAVKRQASATATKTSLDFESLTGCHMHGVTQYVPSHALFPTDC